MSLGGVTYFFTSREVNSYRIHKPFETGSYLELIKRSIFLYDHQKFENRNFATLKTKFQLKTWGFVRIFQPHFGLHFLKISTFLLFLAYNMIVVSYDHDFLHWGNNTGQVDLSDTPNMFLKSTKNVLEAFENFFQLETRGFVRRFQPLIWLMFLPHVLSRNFFQTLLKHFLWTLKTCSEYLEGPPDLYCCPSKKIVTTWHTNHIIC